MEITVRIPDDLADRLGTAGELERRALEALALEEYKLGRLTKPELRRLLGFGTRDALDGFLKAHDVYEQYTLDDLERERQDFQSCLRKCSCPRRWAPSCVIARRRRRYVCGLRSRQRGWKYAQPLPPPMTIRHCGHSIMEKGRHWRSLARSAPILF